MIQKYSDVLCRIRKKYNKQIIHTLTHTNKGWLLPYYIKRVIWKAWRPTWITTQRSEIKFTKEEMLMANTNIQGMFNQINANQINEILLFSCVWITKDEKISWWRLLICNPVSFYLACLLKKTWLCGTTMYLAKNCMSWPLWKVILAMWPNFNQRDIKKSETENSLGRRVQ